MARVLKINVQYFENAAASFWKSGIFFLIYVVVVDICCCCVFSFKNELISHANCIQIGSLDECDEAHGYDGDDSQDVLIFLLDIYCVVESCCCYVFLYKTDQHSPIVLWLTNSVDDDDDVHEYDADDVNEMLIFLIYVVVV